MKNLRELSKREKEVFELAQSGATDREGATKLGIAIGTYKIHLRSIAVKTGQYAKAKPTEVAADAEDNRTN